MVLFGQLYGTQIKAIDIAELSMCGRDQLERFYCIYIYIYTPDIYEELFSTTQYATFQNVFEMAMPSL